MDQLKEILPPPEHPNNPGNEAQWKAFYSDLGTELPSDYKEFIQTYGTGGIDEFLWFLTPFESDENVNFQHRQKQLLEGYLQSKSALPEYFQHEVFPEAGGLLPWAYTENGNELYWLTEGKPDEWSVVIFESRSPEYHQYPLRMTEFLVQIITGELVCDAFPDDFPDEEEPQFISIKIG